MLLVAPGQATGGTLGIQPFRMDDYITFDRVVLPVSYSNATNSTGSVTKSQWYGIYTRNESSLSLLSSTLSTYALTFQGTGANYSLFSSHRLLTIGFSGSLTPGDYWAGIIARTTTGGANATLVNAVISNHAPAAVAFGGLFGTAPSSTQQPQLGQGLYTASTTGFPGSIAFSQINGGNSQGFRPVVWRLTSGTV
jgi:hypothetical protein